MFDFSLAYAVLGLMVGSFLNVCIYRIPRRESIAFPGSHCPGCAKPILPYDNIPVLSYLWLKGRCRHCKARISAQYPVVEFLAGLSFFACWKIWGPTAPAFVNSIFLSVILVLIFIDFQHQILPNVLTLPGAMAGILLCAFQDRSFYRDGPSEALSQLIAPDNPESFLPWVASLLGALAGGGLLFAVGWTYLAVRKRQGLGMGDVKMMTFVGAFLGWRLALLTVFAGSLLGSVAGIFLILFHGRNLQSRLAFGTFLGAGAAISLFLGLQIIDWYSTAH